MPETRETAKVPAEIRDVAREAFSGRPRLADGALALPSDRNPWRALDDALAAVYPAIVPPGHVVVRRDDLETYLNRGTRAGVEREVEALNRLLAASGADHA